MTILLQICLLWIWRLGLQWLNCGDAGAGHDDAVSRILLDEGRNFGPYRWRICIRNYHCRGGAGARQNGEGGICGPPR